MTPSFDEISLDALRAAGGIKWTSFGPESLGAFIAESDLGTAPQVRKALLDAVDADAFGYLPPWLAEEMATECARWQRTRYGWAVEPTDVHPVADVLVALELTLATFTTPGSPVILPLPAYMPFVTLPARLGRDRLDVPVVDGRLDLTALDAAFRAGGELLVLTNPHNPLGKVFTTDELIAIGEVVDRHGGRVFADEIHAPLTYYGARHVPYATIVPGHVVTATSASKAWNLPGLKCAQLIFSSAADGERYADVAGWASHGASTLGVLANAVAYRDGGAWLAELVEYLDGNRTLLAELLGTYVPAARYTPPAGTYLAWIDLSGTGVGAHPAATIRERSGVALVEGTECGAPGAGHVRLNFATPRHILERVVRGIGDAVG